MNSLNSQLSTKWVPGWRPLHRNLIVFSSQADFQLFSSQSPVQNSTGLTTPELNFESESYVTTDGQPASLSWNKAPIWGLRPDLDYCLTVVGLLIWGALSDERTGLPFAIATDPRQRSHFRVRVP
jgi:hypothetical protein